MHDTTLKSRIDPSGLLGFLSFADIDILSSTLINSFVKHVLPIDEIDSLASYVHGFTKRPSGLYHKGKLVSSVSLKQTFKSICK